MPTAKRLRFGLIGAGLTAAVLLASAASATPVVAITEWMYNDQSEFVEFTNMSSAPIDFTAWSFDDASREVGSFSLSGLGTLAPGASGVMSEASAASFRAQWGLADTVAIVGGNSHNLGRSDEINLYDSLGLLVDRLTYNDQTTPGSIRTVNISGNPSTLAVVGANNFAGWVFSANGDAFGSYSTLFASGTGTVTVTGNPGQFLPPVPLPAAFPLLLSGLAGLAVVRRRSRAS